MSQEHDARLRDSWELNAPAWTAAVRGGAIASRTAGTDAAILRACGPVRGRRVLDAGCGEGWLTRALAAAGAHAVGVDASTALIEAARAASSDRYVVADFDALSSAPDLLPGSWELIVCNFALLGDPIVPALAALRARLPAGGELLIQTVHPWVAAGDERYEAGWRVESFAGFGAGFIAPMPWYFRPLGSWVAEIRAAGLSLEGVEEPIHPELARPLSLLLRCRAGS